MKKNYLLFITSVFLIAVMSFTSCSPEYLLTVDCTEGGSVTYSPDSTTFPENESVTLTAVPDSDYYFTSWGGIEAYSEDLATNDDITFIMPDEDTGITAGFAAKNEGWTFLIYMAGDNSLTTYVNDDINEMEQGLYDAIEAGNSKVTEDAVVLVLADYWTRSDDTVLYLLSPDNTDEIVSSEIDDDTFLLDDDLNMGDPDVLSAFIEFGLEEYPSLYNALILWNHGGGSKSIDLDETVSRNICSDETSDDILYNDEVQQAIADGLEAASMDEVDIIGIDACLMGTVETAYELRNLSLYYTGSAASEWGYGWDYEEIFGDFITEDNVPEPSEMADIFVSQYKESTDTESSSDNTMVSIDLSRMETLKDEIDALAAALWVEGDSSAFETQRDVSVNYSYFSYYQTGEIYDYYFYSDIYSLCGDISSSDDFTAETKAAAADVLEALDNAVVSCYGYSSDLGLDYYYTDDASANRGLSIFVTNGEETITSGDSWYGYLDWWYYDQSIEDTNGTIYGNLDFCTSGDTAGTVETWRELFEAWYDTDYDDTPGSY